MILKILVDNNTLIDRYFIGEPGVSFYIEDDGKKILFDLGYSDAFLKNGNKMGVDFLDIDYLSFSHGHLDHTWGIEPFIKRLSEEVFEGGSFKKPKLIAHPNIFDSKTFTGNEEFGINVDKEKLFKYCSDELSKEPVWITKNLVFLGGIPRVNNFECLEPIGKVKIENEWVDDFNIDDSALAYKNKDGLVIITGCSHSGICNIIEYAKQVCNEDRIIDVIGGFHLQNPSAIQLDSTVEYFSKLNLEKMHASHCTDLRSKIAFSKIINVEEVGSGTILKYN